MSSRVSDSSSAPDLRARRRRPERILLVAQIATVAPRVVKVKRKRALKCQNASRSRGKNFIPWVPDVTGEPQDLVEEERMERTVGFLDRYATHKRKRQVSSSGESDVTPVQSAEPSESVINDQLAADGSSEDRSITIPGSPELELTIGPESEGADWSDSNEGGPAPQPLQVILPSGQDEGPHNISEFMRSGLPRLKRLDQVITNNYLPPHGPEPPRVEISAPGEEEVKKILRRWEPFHRGASAADRLNNLYPAMYRVPVAARGMGLYEGYTVPVPASTLNEDFP